MQEAFELVAHQRYAYFAFLWSARISLADLVN
jgi:hypothetical protein